MPNRHLFEAIFRSIVPRPSVLLTHAFDLPVREMAIKDHTEFPRAEGLGVGPPPTGGSGGP